MIQILYRSAQVSPPPSPSISNKINNDITNSSQKILPETGDQMTTELPNNKRPLSVSTEPSLDDGNLFLSPINLKTILTNNTKALTPITSKKRSQSLTRFIENLDETLKPIKPILKDKNNNFILDFHQFKSLLENACSIENPIDITKGKIKNYKNFTKNCVTDHASGGVAIYIEDTILSQEITITSNLEVVAVSYTTYKPTYMQYLSAK